MHGLYCENEHCFTRQSHGTLVPPVACEECKENAFYFEDAENLEGMYQCIACGHQDGTG